MSRCGDVLGRLVERFRQGGVEQARLDARLLLAHALNVDAGWVFTHPEHELSAEQEASVERAAVRRLDREPVSRIIGRREFWGLDFQLSPATLDPRPDTETVVEAVLAQFPDRRSPLGILDLGTGTGCILLSLLTEFPQAHGLGIDLNPGAVATATINAVALDLAARCEMRAGNWCDGMADGQRFDVIVSNPPYIEDGVIAGLEPEVARFDPRLALTGGADGLDAYRALALCVGSRLTPGGIAAFEVGAGQAADVSALLRHAGLHVIAVRRDIAGVERCVIAGAVEG